MVVCPEGHDSASNDFCDVCGTCIGGNPAPSLGRTIGKHHEQRPGVTNGGETCPGCGARVSGQFCEACGFGPRVHRPFAPLVRSADRSRGSSRAPAGLAESLSSPWALEPQPEPSRPPDLSPPWAAGISVPAGVRRNLRLPPGVRRNLRLPPGAVQSRLPPLAVGPGCHPPRPSSPPSRRSPDHPPSPRLRTCGHRYSHRPLWPLRPRPLLNRHSHSWLRSRRRPRLRPRSGWSRRLRSCSSRRPHTRPSLSRR